MYWDPFEEMKRMQAEMQKHFNAVMKSPVLSDLRKRGGELTTVRQPLSDIIDKKNEIVVKMELPGVEKKDVSVKLTETTLEVSAEKKQEIEVKNEKKGFYRHERSYKKFQRSFTLPSPVDVKSAETDLKNGILTISVKKKKAKKILIK